MTRRTAERQEIPVPGIQLTESQRQANAAVLEVLQKPGDSRRFVLVAGIEGAGRHTALRAINPDVEKAGGRVVEGLLGLPERFKGHVVQPQLPADLEHRQEQITRDFPNAEVTVVPLAGMTQQETKDYIGSPAIPDTGLAKYQINWFCLGLPLLAKAFAVPGVTADIASETAKHHLAKSLFSYDQLRQVTPEALKEAEQTYLRTQSLVSLQAFKESFQKGNPDNLYTGIGSILVNRQRLLDQGIAEASPFFVAPESADLYNELLKREVGFALDIFVPEVSDEQYVNIKESIGLGQYGRRWQMFTGLGTFPQHYERLSIYAQIDGQEYYHPSHYHGKLFRDHTAKDMEADVVLLKNKFQAGQLGIAPRTKGNSKSFYMSTCWGEGVTTHNVIWQSWMAQSMFEQMGIPFVVNIDLPPGYDAYVYNPQSRHLGKIPSPFPQGH